MFPNNIVARRKLKIAYALDLVAPLIKSGTGQIQSAKLYNKHAKHHVSYANAMTPDRAYKNKKATSRRRQIDIWKEYEPVAHFWAAHQAWISPDAIPGLKTLC